jgi:predicted nucleic acid-binding protein
VGLIHLDAGVIIGLLDGDDAHHAAARSTIAAAVESGDHLAIAASAVAECLVGPARRGGNSIATVHALFERMPVTIIPLDLAVATAAARLRARLRALRLPDALVIATAAEHDADQLVTTDGKWPSAETLNIRAAIKHI